MFPGCQGVFIGVRERLLGPWVCFLAAKGPFIISREHYLGTRWHFLGAVEHYLGTREHFLGAMEHFLALGSA